MPGALEHFDQRAERDLLLNCHDIGARYHHALDPALAQRQDILEHDGFFGREAGCRLFRGEHEFKVGSRGRCLPAEQNAHDPGEPAFRQRLAAIRHDRRQSAMIALGRFAARGILGHRLRIVFSGVRRRFFAVLAKGLAGDLAKDR